MVPWTYQDKEFDSPGDYYGFCYIIRNLLSGKAYLGRKYFTEAATRQVKGKKKRYRKESNWKDYWGSSKELLEDIEKLGESNFSREILRLTQSRGETSYFESKFIFESDALIREDSYNSWISCRIQRTHLKSLIKKTA